ncbi:hypothetical protein SAMN05720781_1257 [Fibrobacter sp. UWT3]|uniref:DUF2156 domain-containing protein n=1 Tax=Fibrobacter sp. UWT3 TaxID=1896225 RepID=UPI000BCFAC43|nr:phosphatidylglycerol lysyltransferase domain-containing protein [Fibrobacter sp. UWT3]SOE57380.1 hypothetical protein SAMN05720781_1257 [Fibrobacter sp. UWT3]
MINFKTPELSDRASATKAVVDSGYTGSDASFANIFLLRQKYGTQIALQDGFLFRYYNGVGSRRGYAFPLGEGDAAAALALIVEDAHKSGRPLEFCLVDEPRAQILREYFASAGANDAEPPLHFEENRGDSDYIYSAESLANLPGNTYRKKRNHISRFTRTYGQFELREMTPANITDALEVEKRWLNIDDAAPGDSGQETPCDCADAALAERSEDEKSRNAEYCAIVEALENFDALGMKGAVLYVEGKPVSMTMASEIAPGAWDIHFEKVIDEYAVNGGYAIINKLFAERLVTAGAKSINREEDINIEGLRKAKLSYYPQTILDKMHVRVGE